MSQKYIPIEIINSVLCGNLSAFRYSGTAFFLYHNLAFLNACIHSNSFLDSKVLQKDIF